MQFIKNFFKYDSVIGLSALKKKNSYIQITFPDSYKKTFVPNIGKNYLL